MGYVVFSVVILLLIAAASGRSVSRYDYLEVLSYTEWKRGRQVVIDLEKLKGVRISYGSLYANMTRLQQEGFVESKDSEDEDGRIREFRKTSKRRKPREERWRLILRLPGLEPRPA